MFLSIGSGLVLKESRPTGWSGLYPVVEDGVGIGSPPPRRARFARGGAGEPRRRQRLQPAAGSVEGVPLGDVRLGLDLTKSQYRRDARVGIGEHLGPVVAVPAGERLGKPGPQLRPAGTVVLIRQIRGVQAQPGP